MARRRYIYGTDDADTLRGRTRNEAIYGYAGDDRLFGNGGDDYLYGGADNDQLHGGDGDDLLEPGAGTNIAFGEAGDDVFYDGSGVDTLDGGDGFDVVGFDNIDGPTRGAIVNLGTGVVADDGFGHAETWTSIEAVGGTEFADRLTGSDGDNAFYISVGDTVRGLDGDDTVFIDSIGNAIIDGGRGSDLIMFSDYLRDENGHDNKADHGVTVDLAQQRVIDDGFGGSATIVRIEAIEGNWLNDTLLGSASANVLSGRSGQDTIDGRLGDDVIRGGDGSDVLTGGGGRDIFVYGVDPFGGIDDFSYVSGARDTITDFEHRSGGKGDRIDLSQIAAAVGPITFVGEDDTAPHERELSYAYVGGDTVVSLRLSEGHDVLSFVLTGHIHLTASDFIQ